jgi:protein MPE1
MSLDKLYVDKPTRTKVADYIERAIEDSKKEGGEESSSKAETNGNQQQVNICGREIFCIYL